MSNYNKQYWLELDNIELIRESKKLFNCLSLKFKYNENVVLIGPNGSGKSSIIDLIIRNIYPIHKNNSSLKIFGREKINIWEIRKKLSYLNTDLQSRIYPSSTVLEVILSGINGKTRVIESEISSEAEKKANDSLKILDLEKYSMSLFGNLSDGLKRRVLLARAIINKPKILILDEPCIYLDFKSKYIILDYLSKIIRTGTSVLIVTHSIENIIPEIDKVVIINEGLVVKQGTVSECIESQILSDVFNMQVQVKRIRGKLYLLPKE
tara:strand:- start:2097 stop:2894 length:798 start_codon:yes stop_codon:yes gene_type:complete